MSPSSTTTIERVELVEGYGIRWRAEGAGTPFIWAHDALSSIDHDDDEHFIDFDAISAAHRLLRFDAVGHGGSAGVFDPADHEWRARGETLTALGRRLELERFAAGGLGSGAAAALHAAVLAPARVEKLVLVAPTADWAIPACVQRLPSPIGLGLVIGSAEPMRLAARFAPVPRRRNPVADHNAAGWRRLVRARRNQFNAVLIGAARSDYPTPDELAEIDVPALVLAYPGDLTHPVGIAERIADALPDAQLEVTTRPDDVRGWGARIADFLAS